MYNTIAYITYFGISSFITFYVGFRCYTHGYFYILDSFNQRVEHTKSVNNMLLLGYYLVNIGYVAYTLNDWQTVESVNSLLAYVSFRVGTIVILLAILHYANIFVLSLIRKRNNKH